MPRDDDPLAPLRATIEELAAADAASVLNEARIEARSRVRAALTDAFAHSILERLRHQDDAPAPHPPAGPERSAPASVAQPTAPATRQAEDATAGTPAFETASRQSPPSAYAFYVYGVVAADSQLGGTLAGVDPAEPLTTLVEGDLAAVLSRVPMEDFDEARLREHLADMAWVEKTARAHDRALNQIREQATVIPMRMCTVYRTQSGVREWLRGESASLNDALAQLDGTAEWAVKVFTVPLATAETNQAAGAPEESGAAYMQRISAERQSREHAAQAAGEAAAQIDDRLRELARDARQLPLQRPEVTGHEGDMILNGVYLVGDEEAADFQAEVDRLRGEFEARGVLLARTGPWPAYNFIPGAIGAGW